MTRKWTHIRRDIEVVITRRSWKPFVRKGAWVRIPLSPLGIRAADHYIDYQNQLSGEVPKRLKGHPWKGCRSLIAARGFKSLLLRSLNLIERWTLKKFKKCLTSTNSPDILYDCCGNRKQHGFLKRNSKNKKCLTRAESSDKLLNCCCEW